MQLYRLGGKLDPNITLNPPLPQSSSDHQVFHGKPDMVLMTLEIMTALKSLNKGEDSYSVVARLRACLS